MAKSGIRRDGTPLFDVQSRSPVVPGPAGRAPERIRSSRRGDRGKLLPLSLAPEKKLRIVVPEGYAGSILDRISPCDVRALPTTIKLFKRCGHCRGVMIHDHPLSGAIEIGETIPRRDRFDLAVADIRKRVIAGVDRRIPVIPPAMSFHRSSQVQIMFRK